MAIQDYDLRTWDWFPAYALWNEARRLAFDTLTRIGRDLNLGAKLPLLFVQAGIGKPDGTDVVGRFQTSERANFGVRELYRSFAPRAVALGLVSAEQSEKLLEQLKEPPAYEHAVLSPLMIGAWRSKQRWRGERATGSQ